MSEYTEAPTPDLNDLQQLPESDGIIEVPVRVTDIGPVQVHLVPARDAVMRNVNVDTVVQQIAGANLRRKSFTVWASGEELTDFIYIGTDKNEVESNTAAMLPANNIPLVMTHALQLWVKNTTGNTIVLSFVAEDWAD